jgi:hypothetical protein
MNSLAFVNLCPIHIKCLSVVILRILMGFLWLRLCSLAFSLFWLRSLVGEAPDSRWAAKIIQPIHLAKKSKDC